MARKKNIKTCEQCGEKYECERHDAKYCSNVCRTNAYRVRHDPDFIPPKSRTNPMSNEIKIDDFAFVRNDPQPKRVIDVIEKDGKTHYVLEGVGAPVCACAVVTDVETLVRNFEATAKSNWLNRQ